MPVSLKARPYLALRIAFEYTFFFFFFELLGQSFFSPNMPSPSRPKYPCANRQFFLPTRGKSVGFLAPGPDRRGLCSPLKESWCSRSPPELGKVLSQTNEKIHVICRKMSFSKIPSGENTGQTYSSMMRFSEHVSLHMFCPWWFQAPSKTHRLIRVVSEGFDNCVVVSIQP